MQAGLPVCQRTPRQAPPTPALTSGSAPHRGRCATPAHTTGWRGRSRGPPPASAAGHSHQATARAAAQGCSHHLRRCQPQRWQPLQAGAAPAWGRSTCCCRPHRWQPRRCRVQQGQPRPAVAAPAKERSTCCRLLLRCWLAGRCWLPGAVRPAVLAAGLEACKDPPLEAVGPCSTCRLLPDGLAGPKYPQEAGVQAAAALAAGQAAQAAGQQGGGPGLAVAGGAASSEAEVRSRSAGAAHHPRCASLLLPGAEQCRALPGDGPGQRAAAATVPAEPAALQQVVGPLAPALPPPLLAALLMAEQGEAAGTCRPAAPGRSGVQAGLWASQLGRRWLRQPQPRPQSVVLARRCRQRWWR